MMTALVYERVPSDCTLPPLLTRLHFRQELLNERVFMHRLLVTRLFQLGHSLYSLARLP